MGRGIHRDKDALRFKLRTLLARERHMDGPTLCRSLAISPATLSRLAKDAVALGEVITTGGPRNRLYYSVRDVPLVDVPIPIHEVDELGKATRLGELIPTGKKDFVFYWEKSGQKETAFERTPHFLADLIPAGYLARRLPAVFPELSLPADPRLWSADAALRYLTRHAHDTVGNLILGSGAFEAWTGEKIAPPRGILPKEKERVYPSLAEAAIDINGGSSVGGDQPKFLATLADEKNSKLRTPVIVKFSPSLSDKVGRRIADLLIAEHLALLSLSKIGLQVSRSEILMFGGRVFLEVERFDRIPGEVVGRRGVLSLYALDAHFTGISGNWNETTRALARKKIIPESLIDVVLTLELFGILSANTDMHLGNLSFYCRNLGEVTGIAPVYDMTPMHYIPRGGEVTCPSFAAPKLRPPFLPFLSKVLPAACGFWEDVADDSRVSTEFREIARWHRALLEPYKTI